MVHAEVYVNRELAQLIDTVKSDPRYTGSPLLQELVKNLNKALADLNRNLSETSSDEEHELSN